MTTSFPVYWEGIRQSIHDELHRWIPELFGGLPEPQLAALLRCLDAGKRIRGCLVCLTCEALGGRIEAALSRAVGIECIHAASLIHDDYVDGDAVRRHRAAEWTVQGSRQAVLLGDLMFATAIERMAEEGSAEAGLVAHAIATMANGAYREYLDRLNPERVIDDGTGRGHIYDCIIHFKTGVLFGVAAQLGAMVATASAPLCARAFRYGARLGDAYQIADDLADVIHLEQHPRSRSSALEAAGPILLRFTGMTLAELRRLVDGDERSRSRWVRRQLPLVKERMREAVARHCASAVSELGDFPDNHCTRLLRDMPAHIVRSLEVAETAFVEPRRVDAVTSPPGSSPSRRA